MRTKTKKVGMATAVLAFVVGLLGIWATGDYWPDRLGATAFLLVAVSVTCWLGVFVEDNY